MRIVTLALSLLLATGFAGAAAAEEFERPSLLEDFFITETVYAQDQGETQLTLGADYASAEEGKAYTFTAGLEYGLTDQLQIEVEWDAYNHVNPDTAPSVKGTGDVEVGFKYTFETCPTTGLQLAAGFEATLPAGNEDVSENAYVYEPYLVLSKDLGETINLHASVAYGFVDPQTESEESNDELTVSLGSVYRVADAWRLTLEANLESNRFDSGNETAAYVAPGFLWKGIEDIEAGLAVAFGLTDDSDDWHVLGMVSYEF